MKLRVAIALAVLSVASQGFAQDGPDSVVSGKQQFSERVLITGLHNPWEVTWGPDNFLWVTERTAGNITRINPANGSAAVAIQIPEVSAPGPQDGLLGLALHPELLKG